MEYIDSRGQPRRWKFKFRNTKNASRGHIKARELINNIFPCFTVYEEVILPGTKLSVDFLITDIPLGIEVQGQQHYRQISMFHNTKFDFFKQLKRDQKKIDWFIKNKIQLITLDDKDSVDVWRNIIIDKYKNREY